MLQLSEQNDQMSDKIKVITEQLKEQESRGDDLERDISTLKLRYTELEGKERDEEMVVSCIHTYRGFRDSGRQVCSS